MTRNDAGVFDNHITFRGDAVIGNNAEKRAMIATLSATVYPRSLAKPLSYLEGVVIMSDFVGDAGLRTYDEYLRRVVRYELYFYG